MVEVGAGTGLVSMTAAMLGAADVLRGVERAVLVVSLQLAIPVAWGARLRAADF